MSNSFYSASGAPSTSSQGLSATMRAEFTLIQAAFDLMPTLSGNGLKAIRVNAGGTTLEAVAVTGTGSAVFSTSPTLVTPVLGVASGTTLSLSGQFTSTLATGTAPFVVASTTLVSNLYAARAALADTATTNANLSGPITSSGNTTAVASQTGTGTKFVMDTSPTLVTPNIGVATATTVNGVGFIAGAVGKALTLSNTLTLSGTDGSTLNIGTGGTLGTAAYTASTAYASIASVTTNLAATGGTMDNVTIGNTTRASVFCTRVVQDKNIYTPTLNQNFAVDWSMAGATIAVNGVHTLTFSNIGTGFATEFIYVDNFNSITWPAAVDWGVAGKPSIAGGAYVSFATRDHGSTIPAAIFWQAV